MMSKFVVVDIETTGNAAKRGDKIIQFAAVTIENNKITNTYSTFVNPMQPIPPFIEQFTNINDDMVKDAPTFDLIADTIFQLFEGAYFVAHNVAFDLSFLKIELENCGITWKEIPYLDTVELSRICFPTVDSYQLSELTKQLGFSHDRPHHADSDAYATANILLLIMEKFKQLPILTLEQLIKISSRLKGYIDLFLTELNQSIKKPNNLNKQYQIHHGLVIYQPISLEQSVNKVVNYPHTLEEKVQLFTKEGFTFENRKEQFIYMDQVYHSLVNNHHTLLEAATGVGKTLAYLIAATIYTNQTNKQVIISTNTTSLQDQLILKDLPMLEKILNQKVEVAVLKGKSHYIHLSKFAYSLDNKEDNDEIQLTKMQILVWLTFTKTGDVDELNLSTAGKLFFNEIKHSEFIVNKKKPTFDYYLLAKNKVKTASLIITNHAMLVTDWKRNSSNLKEMENIIFDEGHHLATMTRKIYGKQLFYKKIKYYLNQLGTIEQQNSLYEVTNLVDQMKWKKDYAIFSFEINEYITDLLVKTENFFLFLNTTLSTYNRMHEQEQKIVVSYEQLKRKDQLPLKEYVDSILFSLRPFNQLLVDLYGTIKENDIQHLTSEKLRHINYFLMLVEELKNYEEDLNSLFFKNEKELTWFEYDLKTQLTSIYTEPILVNEILADKWKSKVKTAIITSATLSVNGKFDFLKEQLGLNSLPVVEQSLPSPFDYSKQMKFIIPTDLPAINNEKNEEYIYACTEHIISIAESSGGRMLILFTSYEMLKRCYYLLKESELLEDYTILAQGITAGSRSRLQKNFQKVKKSILLGTSSFWEGIDIPGTALSCLVIVRLPFNVPNEPISTKVYAKLKEEGKNPFMEYALNEAIIRFKQGIGRLIRSKEDKGILFVFDNRLVKSSYGKLFLRSIPVEPELLTINQITEETKKWLDE